MNQYVNTPFKAFVIYELFVQHIGRLNKSDSGRIMQRNCIYRNEIEAEKKKTNTPSLKHLIYKEGLNQK